MNRVKDMLGYEADFFKVIGRSDKHDKTYCAYWHCLCICGEKFEARGLDIRRGRQKSCGCKSVRKGVPNLATRTHGAFAIDACPEARRTYSSWHNSVDRCENPKNTGFRYYGGKGVSVCARWNPKLGGSFENFVSDTGYRPKGTTLGRIVDSGDYEPGNCYWMSQRQQNISRICKGLLRKLVADCPELIPDINLYDFRIAA
jgi:hypothetical protein